MSHYQVLEQEDSIKASIDPFFKTLPQIALAPAVEEEQYSHWFVGLMFPSLCNPHHLKKPQTSSIFSKSPPFDGKKPESSTPEGGTMH